MISLEGRCPEPVAASQPSPLYLGIDPGAQGEGWISFNGGEIYL